MTRPEIEPRPIPLFKTKPVEIPELPPWIQEKINDPLKVHVSIFDRFYLLAHETITYSKWALVLLRFTIALILFIQKLRREENV